jgi:hypothetical protein
MATQSAEVAAHSVPGPYAPISQVLSSGASTVAKPQLSPYTAR